MANREILSASIKQQDRFCRVKKWVKGWHPGEGKLTIGLTGKETVITEDAVLPIGEFEVKDERAG